MLVGIVAAALALYFFRPGTSLPSNALTTTAAFFPLLPLLFGLSVRFGGQTTVPVIAVHALLGIAAVGLVEAASARRRRMLRAAACLLYLVGMAAALTRAP